jgi:two-component system sensor histidine kinase HupT/HoxJ
VNFRVTVDVPPELPVFGSPGQLQQVLINLVQNAADATEKTEDPQLTITTEPNAERVVVLFRDNGPGIPEDVLGKIFDPFFTTKPVGKGTGLGLSISYGIVERHGGELSVRNAAQGGAEFRMCLPKVKR